MARFQNGNIIKMTKEIFLSVDWGTTNFRLKVVECGSLKVIAESFVPNAGAKSLFDHWKRKGGDRKSLFIDFLKNQINQLPIKNLQNCPVIISGMASSSIGIMELPYANLPFRVNGENAVIKFLKPDSFGLNIFLISGIKSNTDVLRGEETQLLGCIKENDNTTGDQLFIFPGTHSKHILVRKNQVVGFKTYMTGEFFNLLFTNSVLSNSMQKERRTTPERIRNSFENGLKAAMGGNLLNEAFFIRTNDLFKKISKKDNFYYLSGLLIGSELQNLPSELYEQIFVVCGSTLYAYYKLAFKILQLPFKVKIVSPKASEKLVIKGQYKLLKNNNKMKW